jgi:hypothetical protein
MLLHLPSALERLGAQPPHAVPEAGRSIDLAELEVQIRIM